MDVAYMQAKYEFLRDRAEKNTISVHRKCGFPEPTEATMAHAHHRKYKHLSIHIYRPTAANAGKLLQPVCCLLKYIESEEQD